MSSGPCIRWLGISCAPVLGQNAVENNASHGISATPQVWWIATTKESGCGGHVICNVLGLGQGWTNIHVQSQRKSWVHFFVKHGHSRLETSWRMYVFSQHNSQIKDPIQISKRRTNITWLGSVERILASTHSREFSASYTTGRMAWKHTQKMGMVLQ